MDEDDRKRLYDHFRDQIGLPDSNTAYFDEDDLIDIYDYASDHQDDFTRMEVLFYAARHCPDSEQLQVRRDYFYYYLGYDDAVATRLERRRDKSTLARLLRMRQKAQDNDLGQARNPRSSVTLKRILDKAEMLDDEETIQFVAEAAAPEAYPWLKENIDLIKAKVDYKPTLLYEAAYAAIDNDDPAFAIKMAEELTMLEPFNPDFWELLTFSQMKAERFDDARTSVDYALALAPESARSMAYKGRLLTMADPLSREGADLLLRAFANPPSTPDFDEVKVLAQPLLAQNRYDELEAALAKRLEADPLNTSVIDGLLIVHSANSLDAAEKYLEAPGFPASESFWTGWASRFIDSHNFAVAALILSSAARHGYIRPDNCLLLEALYLAGRYAEVVEASPLKPDRDFPEPLLVEVALITILAYLRLKNWEVAKKLISEVGSPHISFDLTAPDAPDIPFGTEILAQYGAATLLKSLTLASKFLGEHTGMLDIDNFDPFTLFARL